VNILWHMPALQEIGDGLSMRALALASQLARRGHAIRFCVPKSRLTVAAKSISGFPVLSLPEKALGKPIHWCLQGLHRAAAARALIEDLDVAHDLFISCQAEVIRAYCRRRSRKPAIFVSGSSTLLFDGADRVDQARLGFASRMCYAIDRTIKRRNEAAAYRAADRVVFDSHPTRERVMATYGIGGESLQTIEGGVDPIVFAPPTSDQRRAARRRLEVSDDTIVVIGTGRLVERKGFELLVAALKRLDRRMIGVIVGDGPKLGTLQRLAVAEPNSVDVRFVGMTGDVASHLHAGDIYVFTSICESFGAALAEAMACGLPCIAIRSDGLRVATANHDIIEDGVSGILCDATAEDLARCISQLADDSKLRQRMGEAAAAQAAARFTWSRAGLALSTLVDSLNNGVSLPRNIAAIQG